MKIEVEKFEDMTQDLAQKCQVKYVPQNELPMNKKLYGQDTLGYEILGIKEHPQCQWMAMDELKFIDFIRKLQHEKIVWSQYAYNPSNGNKTTPIKVTKNQSYDLKYKRLKPHKNEVVWQNHIQNLDSKFDKNPKLRKKVITS